MEIFTDHGKHLVSYPRPETTGVYYGPRSAPTGTPMKTAGQNPSAGPYGTASRTVSRGGYVGALASKFYAGYKRVGDRVTETWTPTTITLSDTAGETIATYDMPTTTRGSHGPAEQRPSTKP